jgi:cytochrome c oxidase cbb3-type subunit III
MPRGLLQWVTLVLLVNIAHVLSSGQLQPRPQSPKSSVKDNGREGKQIFSSTCAACHGLDGSGGERGPDLAHQRHVQQLSDNDLSRIIQEGIPGTAMPSFRSLGHLRIQAVVRHLRILQGQRDAVQVSGDPKRGKDLFFGKAGCSQCHMVNGEGGFIGSDLSSYASAHSADDIRSAITDPNTNLDPRNRTVIVTTRDGKTQAGLARNEDNFSLQLQTVDGAFHFFTKSALQDIQYQPQSLMPSDYKSKLNRKAVDDIVGYLMSISIRRVDNKAHVEKE